MTSWRVPSVFGFVLGVAAQVVGIFTDVTWLRRLGIAIWAAAVTIAAAVWWPHRNDDAPLRQG